MRRGPAAVALWWGLATTLLAGTDAAFAQPEAVIEPSAASLCLTATDPKLPEPEYPFKAYKRNEPGRVHVSLRFVRADRPPTVEVLASEGDGEFVLNVRRYARTLRVPCLPAGARAELTQDYLFRTNQSQVQVQAPRDAKEERQRALLACRQHESGEAAPIYPHRAERERVAGNVLALLRFSAPDQPPDLLQLGHAPQARVLARTVQHWVSGYRLPCFDAEQDEPVTTTITFMFRFPDHPMGFKALSLPQFMARTKDLQQQTIAFDTHAMGCPFELRLQYRQPTWPNRVYSVGEELASRAPLMAWLRDAQLDLRSRDLAAVYGDTADIAVPCVKVNLKPKE